MKKKIVLIIACVAALVMGFAGCGSSNFGVVVNEDLNIEITAENADKEGGIVPEDSQEEIDDQGVDQGQFF